MNLFTSQEPRREQGAPIPLFDRLINEHPEEDTEIPVKRYYSKQALVKSIEREVIGLLNTRAGARLHDYRELIQDKRNFGLPQVYGLPDFSQYDGARSGDWDYIARMCEQVIEQYEPRLIHVEAMVNMFEREKQSLNMHISAELAVQGFWGSVTFPVHILIG